MGLAHPHHARRPRRRPQGFEAEAPLSLLLIALMIAVAIEAAVIVYIILKIRNMENPDG